MIKEKKKRNEIIKVSRYYQLKRDKKSEMNNTNNVFYNLFSIVFFCCSCKVKKLLSKIKKRLQASWQRRRTWG